MKQSQIKKTLAQTEANLEKARSDLSRAQQKVQMLTQRIPELQRAVDSLRVLCGIKQKTKSLMESVTKVAMDGGKQMVESFVKTDIMKLAGPQDLTGMGSIPAGSGPHAPQLEEDELLPDPEGETILE